MGNVDRKLSLEQAIEIRDDFKYLEGNTFEQGGIYLTIKKIIVGPYYSQKLNEFLQVYRQNENENIENEELLASSFKPASYCVYTLYENISKVFFHDNIFNLIEELKLDIDLSKYRLNN